MDPFFIWVETSWLSVWLREAITLWAFPFVLICHTVGLAFLVGVNVAIDLRALGGAMGVPLVALKRYYRVMWTAFWVNAVSGVLLLIAYPTKALTNPVFYLKLTLIGVGLVLAGKIRPFVASGTIGATDSAPPALKRLAAISLVVWVAAITAGRLLAYTCSRLTVDTVCQ